MLTFKGEREGSIFYNCMAAASSTPNAVGLHAPSSAGLGGIKVEQVFKLPFSSVSLKTPEVLESTTSSSAFTSHEEGQDTTSSYGST